MAFVVVSGLGPNGLFAALSLQSAGHHVVGVERRPNYVRGIHLSLRETWIDDVRRLDPALFDKLRSIIRPIETIEHLGARPKHPPPVARSALIRRLEAAPHVNVRLDELERLFLDHLRQRPNVEVLAEHHLRLTGEGPRYGVRCEAADGRARSFEAPELVVIAEGGKSPTARQLGLEMMPLSSPRFYVSVHVETGLGPVTRRLDTVIDGTNVSYWAIGHADPARGTWLVLEIPAHLHAGQPSARIDQAYFELGAMLLLGTSRPPHPSEGGLKGTFRFQQQILEKATAGANVVFFGDAAGMGHHALATGLEVGAADTPSLLSLAAGSRSLDAYDRDVRASRIEAMAY
jgi:2-polyprenyl-6-methoxyphenol hydroxylase-like FAD-dependent oxidoreductase